MKLKQTTNMNKKLILASLVATGALLVSASSARANAVLTLLAGISSTSITLPNNTAGGFTTIAFDGWTVTSDTGDNTGGTLSSPFLNVSSQSQGGSSPQALEVIWSQTDYTFNGTLEASLTQVFGQGVTMNTFENTANVAATGSLYPVTPAGTLLTTQIIGPGPGQAAANMFATVSGSPYALTEELLISATTAQASVQGNLFVPFVPTVPDSGLTLTMLGACFLGVAGLRSKWSFKS